MATQAVNPDQATVFIRCATCNSPWDQGEDAGEHFDSEDGEYYCVGRCLTVARETSYRRQVFESVERGIREAMDEIERLDKEFKDILPDVVDHPYSVLDDVLMRATLFAQGKDSGWRDGLMLSPEEAADLYCSGEHQINKLSFSLRWDLGLNPLQTKIREGEYEAGRRSVELVRLGQQLLNLRAWRERTQKGVEA
jgi:hypothetical protein